jgi:hypothetical protein
MAVVVPVGAAASSQAPSDVGEGVNFDVVVGRQGREQMQLGIGKCRLEQGFALDAGQIGVGIGIEILIESAGGIELAGADQRAGGVVAIGAEIGNGHGFAGVDQEQQRSSARPGNGKRERRPEQENQQGHQQ